MEDLPSTTVGNIRDLTDDVIARTMATLRDKLTANEFQALEELVMAGTFLTKGAILSAISHVQMREGI